MSTDPQWTYNLLSRSESFVDFLRRQTPFSQLEKRYMDAISFSSRETLADEEAMSEIEKQAHYRGVIHCIITNLLEGSAVGGGISVLVSTLPALLKGNFKKVGKGVLTSNNARVALFMGFIMTIHNTSLYIGKSRTRIGSRFKFLIGLLSGVSVSILPMGVRRFLVYLLFTRSLEVLVRKSRADSGRVETFSSHESVGLTMGSMAIITTTWFGWPQLINKGYLHFLDNISDIDKSQFRDIGIILRNRIPENRPELMPMRQKPCLAFHSHSEDCRRFVVRMWILALVKRTIPFYFKIYQIPLLFHLVKRRGKVSLNVVTHFFSRLWWSGFFLSVLDALVGATCCAVSNQRIMPKWTMMPLCGAVSGLSLYIEQPDRRLELALYMFGQAVQMITAAWQFNGLPSPRGTDLVVSALSIGVLTSVMEDDIEGKPLVLRRGYYDLLTKILDTEARRHSFRIV
jgi:hypothetical protein